jgi:hypothetical protein
LPPPFGGESLAKDDLILDWIIEKIEKWVEISKGVESRTMKEAIDIRVMYYSELAETRMQELRDELG